VYALVRTSGTGFHITNATFNYGATNNGNGWYWVAVPANANLCCSAPGYIQYCFNVGTGPNTPGIYAYFNLQPVPTPPPPPSPPTSGW
jgi:hypothetical protein